MNICVKGIYINHFPISQIMFIEKIINGGAIAYPQVFFKLAVYSVTKVETDTLQARHELEFLYPNKTLFCFVNYNPSVWFFWTPISHIVIHALTRFNHNPTLPFVFQARSYKGMDQSLIDFPYTHYIFACSLQYNDFLTVFQP